jgi:hypothetical protein
MEIRNSQNQALSDAAGDFRISIFEFQKGGSNSVVESQPSKLLVAGSIPVSRSKKLSAFSRQRSTPSHVELNADR